MTTQSPAESTGGIALRDVVTGVVEELAPDERPLLDALSGFDDVTALRRLTARDDRQESLAFGIDAATALVTLVVWITLDETVRLIVDGTIGRLGKPKRSRRKRLFGRRRTAEPVIVPPLTADQLKQVGRSTADTAREVGFSDEQAEQIARSVVGRLVLAPPQLPR